jgi:hypothetical protein
MFMAENGRRPDTQKGPPDPNKKRTFMMQIHAGGSDDDAATKGAVEMRMGVT